MGAKRSVEGRSQPYDTLLAAYQKKSIGRPNATTAPVKTDEIMTTVKTNEDQQQQQHFIDSDEEVENIMQALKYSQPIPLAQKSYYFVKRRRQCFRLRDILLDAITPNK